MLSVSRPLFRLHDRAALEPVALEEFDEDGGQVVAHVQDVVAATLRSVGALQSGLPQRGGTPSLAQVGHDQGASREWRASGDVAQARGGLHWCRGRATVHGGPRGLRACSVARGALVALPGGVTGDVLHSQ